MENEKEQNQPATASTSSDNDLESLEAQTTVVEDGSTPASGAAGSPKPSTTEPDDKKKKKKPSIKGLAAHFNVYLLLFVFLIIIAGVSTAISVIKSKQAATDSQKITTEPLSKEALDKLRQTDVKVGDPKQVLSVESNAIFAGTVLMRGSLEVAGEIKAGAPMTLPGLNVSGNSSFNQVQASQLQVNGATNIQGQLNVQSNLSVTGSGSFGGTLTAGKLNIQDLQISGDLQFTRHLDSGGGTPGKSDGSALGGGGTSSISGTDTAGTVAINTGGGPAVGCFATINFTQRFNGTPHVVITPVGSAAAGLNYYINRSSSNFSICTTNAAPGGQSFAFDYVVFN